LTFIFSKIASLEPLRACIQTLVNLIENSKMATSKQEQIYNEIIEYYNYADRLIKAAEDASHPLSAEQFTIVEEITNCLEDSADKLTTQYIEFVKNGESAQIVEEVREALNSISSRIEECRNKVLMLHKVT